MLLLSCDSHQMAVAIETVMCLAIFGVPLLFIGRAVSACFDAPTPQRPRLDQQRTSDGGSCGDGGGGGCG
jgi:hypothetical protein